MLMDEKLEPLLSAFKADRELYLVAPDDREKEIVAQLRRPSLAAAGELGISYILFAALKAHCASICQLGDDHRIMRKIARCPC
jgi:type II restriction enzyme